MATPTGFEPAISSVTGRRDNHFTTESRRNLRDYLVLPGGKSFGLWLGSSSQNCESSHNFGFSLH
jgi:hypothetical protein